MSSMEKLPEERKDDPEENEVAPDRYDKLLMAELILSLSHLELPIDERFEEVEVEVIVLVPLDPLLLERRECSSPVCCPPPHPL